jgi:hypothetical protein
MSSRADRRELSEARLARAREREHLRLGVVDVLEAIVRSPDRKGAWVFATKALLGQRRLQRPFPSPLGRGMGSRPGHKREPTYDFCEARRVWSTSLDWFETGRLPGFKLGLCREFCESEVLDWLEAPRLGRPPETPGSSEI